MVVRVAERVRQARRIDEVWVATDAEVIAEVVRAAGFEAVLTDVACASGTDRVARAVAQRDRRIGVVINVQGDEPLIDPSDLDRLVDAVERRPDAIATLARPRAPLEDRNDPNVVKVARAEDGRALYFSRAPIPHGGTGPFDLIHVGVYAYAPPVLDAFVSSAPSALEELEKLEQLRALENGIPIYVAISNSATPTIGVDVPADVHRVEAALQTSDQHGEPERGTF